MNAPLAAATLRAEPALHDAAESPGYRLEAFGPAEWPRALEMLVRGFPRTQRGWWQAGFARSQAVPNNAPDMPIGKFLVGPGGLSGVTLLYASRRPVGAAAQLHINLSSWAMAPESRGRAMWSVRNCLSEPTAVYTSLTPIASTARILQRLRFEPISHQLVLAATPKLALARPGGPRVLGPADTLAALRGDPMIGALTDHHRLGCLVAAIETPRGLQPMVWRRRGRRLGLAVAELVYVPSVAEVAQAIGPIARFLLRHGYPLLEFEARDDASIEFPSTQLFRRRLASGPYPRHGIDHLYSELVYLHR